MSDAKRSIARAALAGFGFSVAEAVAVWMNPAPTDPVPTWTVVALSVIGTTLLLAAVATAMCAVSRRHAGVLALTAWAAIWGPHTAELAGWHRVGWAPAIVIAGLGPYAPVGIVALTVASGAAGPALRDGGAAQGLVAINRDAPDRTRQPDVLLITVEGISSKDGMLDEGRWGPKSPFSPIHGWTHYTTAIAPAPWALPSMHSVLTSLPVRDHGGGLPTGSGHSARLDGALSLPVALQQGGYQTSAVVASPHLTPEYGFADGFDSWIHAAQTREPLVLVGQWNRLRSQWFSEQSEVAQDKDRRLVAHAQKQMDTPTARPRFVWMHLSSGDVVEARAAIMKLANAHQGWVIAVTSLHGTDPAASTAQAPSRFLSDDSLRVPLAIRRPGVEGGVEDSQVAVADLAHTLLAYAGRAHPFPGRNLHNPRRRRIVVGGARGDAKTSAARTPDGKYLPVDGGRVGRTVRLADSTREGLKAAGYTD
jgi:hypothetical protein